MAKAPKKYTGNIQFDVWGNLVDWERTDKVYLNDDNFENGKIVLDHQWDNVIKQYVKKPVFFTPDELGLVLFPTPQTRNHWSNDLYIGEMNMFVNMPNFEFQDTLEYDDYGSTLYTKFFCMKSRTTGRQYRVFLKELKSFIEIMDKGVCSGTFTFCKRNHKFGLQVA